MPTAIVTGATGEDYPPRLDVSSHRRYERSLARAEGILGREIVLELGKNPSQWSKVHALSRRRKDEYPPAVGHGFIDLQASADEMVKKL
jgi:hypothetical protein